MDYGVSRKGEAPMNRKEMEMLRDKLVPTVAEALTMADDVFDEYKKRKSRGQEEENPSFDDEPDMKDRMICAQVIMTAGVQLMLMESAKKEMAAVKDREVPAVTEPPRISSGIPEAKLSPGGPIFIGGPVSAESNRTITEYFRRAMRDFVGAAEKNGISKVEIKKVFNFLLNTVEWSDQNARGGQRGSFLEMLDALNYLMMQGLNIDALEVNEMKEPGNP
jgi:hypothetical protein